MPVTCMRFLTVSIGSVASLATAPAAALLHHRRADCAMAAMPRADRVEGVVVHVLLELVVGGELDSRAGRNLQHGGHQPCQSQVRRNAARSPNVGWV